MAYLLLVISPASGCARNSALGRDKMATVACPKCREPMPVNFFSNKFTCPTCGTVSKFGGIKAEDELIIKVVE